MADRFKLGDTVIYNTKYYPNQQQLRKYKIIDLNRKDNMVEIEDKLNGLVFFAYQSDLIVVED